jgi:rhodanese-related sulfurtransferase
MAAYKTGQQLLDEARARVREISARDAIALRAARRDVVFLDIREQPEVNLGMIPGAVHLARGSMETKIEALVPREKRVIIYCANGNRSAFAADTLQQMGYGEVESMAGGFRDWVSLGGDVEG